jgi:4-carboxymuconolactone decarboxylase
MTFMTQFNGKIAAEGLRPTFGRYAEIPIDKMTPQQKEGYDYVVKERTMVPGPFKIFVQNPNLMDLMVPMGVYFQLNNSSLSSAESEIAISLINGKWMAAYSNYEHEMIGQNAGLSATQMQALIAGLPTSFENPRQQVIYEITQTLIAPRVVPTGLYQRAVELLGHKGITDLTVLLGYFTAVSLTLRAYDVPSDAIGLAR